MLDRYGWKSGGMFWYRSHSGMRILASSCSLSENESMVLKRALVVREVFHLHVPYIVSVEQRLDEVWLSVGDV